MSFIIDANSTPVYDGWGWSDYWSPQDWIAWHKALKQAYGKDQANAIFIEAYHKPSNEFEGLGMAHFGWRTFDSAFKNYAKLNNFYDALFSGIYGVILKPASVGVGVVNTVTDVVDNTAAGVENVSKGVTNTGKVLQYALPIGLTIVGLGALAYGYKTFVRDAK